MAKFINTIVIALFGLLYSWDVWEAVGNLVGLGPFYEALGIGQDMPWPLLWAGVIIPVLVFAVALWWGKRRSNLLERVVILVTGWAVVAAVTMSLAAIEQAWRAAALLGLAG